MEPFRDDLSHEPEARPGWRESFYFETFDPKAGIGLFNTAGERPANGHSGSLLAVWDTEGPIYCTSEYDEVRRTDRCHRVQSLVYECLEPGYRWRIAFDGRLRRHEPTNGRVDPDITRGRPRNDWPDLPVAYELTYDAIHPPYLYHGVGEWASLFQGHIDQLGRVKGHVLVDGRTYTVDAIGTRDRSWGARDWTRPEWWRFGYFTFERLHAVWWQARLGQQTLVEGYVLEDGQLLPIHEMDVRTEYAHAPGNPEPRQFTISIGYGRTRCLQLEADVLRIVPAVLAHPSRNPERLAWIDRCLVRYRLNGEESIGQMEHEQTVAL